MTNLTPQQLAILTDAGDAFAKDDGGKHVEIGEAIKAALREIEFLGKALDQEVYVNKLWTLLNESLGHLDSNDNAVVVLTAEDIGQLKRLLQLDAKHEAGCEQ